MFETVIDINCYRLLNADNINNIGIESGKYQIFFFLKEHSGSFMYDGNWKDIHGYQVFFVTPHEEFSINCNEADADCFYISFSSPNKVPWNNFDNIIIYQEFRADFLELSINLALACLMKNQNESTNHLMCILQRLDQMLTESHIVFATRHFDIILRGFPRHFHTREYQVDYCAVGLGYYYIKNHWVEYSPGTFCFVPPNIIHEIILSPKSKVDIYSFKFLLVKDPYIMCPPTKPFTVKVPPESQSRVLSIMKKIIGQYIQDIDISPGILNNLITLLHELKNSLDYLENDDLLSRVKQIIDTGYSYPLKITEIASQINLTPEHLSRQFKELSGQTLASYINNLRLNSSITMLMSTEMPLKQIASECGFKNVNYFNTVFKKCYAVTPNEIRRQTPAS
jgi:AraC-like DNA-binding protein